MKKSILVFVDRVDKFIAWIGNDRFIRIQGFKTTTEAQEYLERVVDSTLITTFGIYNGCSTELIKRLLKLGE